MVYGGTIRAGCSELHSKASGGVTADKLDIVSAFQSYGQHRSPDRLPKSSAGRS